MEDEIMIGYEYYNMTLAQFGEYFGLSQECLLSEVENWFGFDKMVEFVDDLIKTYDLDVSELEEEEEEEEEENYV